MKETFEPMNPLTNGSSSSFAGPNRSTSRPIFMEYHFLPKIGPAISNFL